jgi:hypothetical protein
MVDYDPQEKEVVKKLDLVLIPILSICLLCFQWGRGWQQLCSMEGFLTRQNLENYLKYKNEDLGIKAWLFASTFGGMVFGVPAIYYSKTAGPSTWLSIKLR